jgi:hypothetical protein
MKNIAHHELLAAALAGYERQLHDIQARTIAFDARLAITYIQRQHRAHQGVDLSAARRASAWRQDNEDAG